MCSVEPLHRNVSKLYWSFTIVTSNIFMSRASFCMCRGVVYV